MTDRESASPGGALRVEVVTSLPQLMQAYSVRSICFVQERGLNYRQEFDGNDLNATHFLLFSDEEPIGTSRVRWFSGFAKIEKTAIRSEYRGRRTLKFYSEYVFAHVARKGYSTLITTAEEKYARLWERWLGFQRVPGRSAFKPGKATEFFEMIKYLDVPADAVSLQSPPQVLFRIEGYWDRPSPSFG